VPACASPWRVAGHNAAADLLGEPTLPYDQPVYVTCLDLGPDVAILTRGWSAKTRENR
jgi:NADH dehydrogenase